MNRLTGYVVVKQNCSGDCSYIETNLSIEEARKYIENEYCLDAPDEDNDVYSLNDDVKVVIEKAPTIDELMRALNGMLKGLEEAGTYGWYLSDYEKIKEVIYAVGSIDNLN